MRQVWSSNLGKLGLEASLISYLKNLQLVLHLLGVAGLKGFRSLLTPLQVSPAHTLAPRLRDGNAYSIRKDEKMFREMNGEELDEESGYIYKNN